MDSGFIVEENALVHPHANVHMDFRATKGNLCIVLHLLMQSQDKRDYVSMTDASTVSYNTNVHKREHLGLNVVGLLMSSLRISDLAESYCAHLSGPKVFLSSCEPGDFQVILETIQSTFPLTT